MTPGQFAHPLLVELQNEPLPLLENGVEQWVRGTPEDSDFGSTLSDDYQWYKSHFNAVTSWTPDSVDRLISYLRASHGFLSPGETYRLTWEIVVNRNERLALEMARLESEVMLSAQRAIRSVLDKVKKSGVELAKLYEAFQSERVIVFTEYAARTYLEGQKHLLLLFRVFRSVVLNCSLALETIDDSGRSVLRIKGESSSEELRATGSDLRGAFEILTIENTEIESFSRVKSEDQIMTGSLFKRMNLEHNYVTTLLDFSETTVEIAYMRPGLGMVTGITRVSTGELNFKMLGEMRIFFHSPHETRIIFCSRHEVVVAEGSRVILRVRESVSALPRYLAKSAQIFIPTGSGEIWSLTREGQIYKYSSISEIVSALQFGKDLQLQLALFSESTAESLRPVPPLEIEVTGDPLELMLTESLFLGTAGDYRQKSKYPKNVRELIELGPRALMELGVSKRTITKLEARCPRLIRHAWGDNQWPTAKISSELLAMRSAGFNVARDDYAEEIAHSPSISEAVRFKRFTPILSWAYSDQLGLCLTLAEGLRICLSQSLDKFLIEVPPISERFHRASSTFQGPSGSAERVDFMTYKFSKPELALMEIYSQSFANLDRESRK
jgi:hypothetical protein